MRLLPFCCILLCVAGLTAAAHGGGPADFFSQQAQQLAQQSFQKWQSAYSNRVSPQLGRGTVVDSVEAREKVLKEYLSRLVPAMKLSPAVAHIPNEWPVSVDTTSPQKRWTAFYAEVKEKLRPEVKYEWSSSATVGSTFVTLTPEHIDALRDNTDVLMWYRNELDTKSLDTYDSGTEHFKLFLDHIVAGIIAGLPSPPEIDMDTGLMSVPEWKLDEKTLREQLAMTYRYLVAKYMTYPQYEEFGPADRELTMSLMKIAYLMGANIEFEWMENMDISLNRVTSTTIWKEPIRRAFEVMQREENVADEVERQYAYYDEQPCVITIPPPKPKQKPKPPSPPKQMEGHRIEIIIHQNEQEKQGDG